MAGSWQVIAATCHGFFGLFMRQKSYMAGMAAFFETSTKKTQKIYIGV
jgi:hypothetical protein